VANEVRLRLAALGENTFSGEVILTSRPSISRSLRSLAGAP
jgi:hypothetical protein